LLHDRDASLIDELTRIDMPPGIPAVEAKPDLVREVGRLVGYRTTEAPVREFTPGDRAHPYENDSPQRSGLRSCIGSVPRS
jgi:hypothetical protein